MSPANGHANDSTNISTTPVQQLGLASDVSIPTALTLTATKIKELIANLEVPFHPSVIEWRVTNTSKSRPPRGQVMPYADQRAYTDRLNALVTPAGWTRRYAVHTSANFERSKDKKIAAKVVVTCELTIFGLGSHSATGEEWADDDNAATAAEAQSFKRACSCFGLGRYLYYFTGTWVDLDERKRPKIVPKLDGWATPEGWRRGLRPHAEVDSRPERTTAGSEGHGDGHSNGKDASDQGASLVREIEQMRPANAEPKPNSSIDDDKKTVAALDSEYQAAVKINDASTMNRILADDFVLVTGSGKTYTKADMLEEARRGDIYSQNDEEVQTVRVWGNTAVVTAKLWEKYTSNGKSFDHKFWFSDTYVRTSEGWKYVFGQSSLPLAVPAASVSSSPNSSDASTERDGQHDFDFEIGTWKSHISRRLHPLTGSTTWVEMEATVVIRKVWNGRANLMELEADAPTGHLEELNLRLYNPQTHRWSFNFATSSDGTIAPPMIGEFKNGRGEFIDQEPFNGKTILVRHVFTDITPESHHFEQAFSEDGGKTWEPNFVATLTRKND